ncbi:hypothetical protein BO94DRAFT_621161 [Aspergillus sclerotioniger CBS 115572]|uniref:Uncharacterized protein n=1 Tax=Aspergillus sclerotioniger CBS 115572 TaxID=1450535 RepID=A0A317X954_9EURO|nr:hypothetical protein BO94DRAFT_621161 [Aspergillus sclerotioniger CBS 115572]PWY94701.1 hypothetical protein BO94DRAFT_621161 [Aspergillus sclerotioniger CBS 115572]
MEFPTQKADPCTGARPPIATDMGTSSIDILLMDGADTLVFIDPPSYRPTWLMQPHSVTSVPHRIQSKSLLSTESSYFTKLFEPRKQARIIKRRDLEGKLPGGIKYAIDLTPPSTDDEAVAFTTELSCPLGIRSWARASQRWRLPAKYVEGRDEDEHNLPSEYSESRHRMGILHILQALGGVSPILDTPCKLWTFFALAKVFDVARQGQIKVEILTWIYESNNARLIEIHPEITYRIACGIQCDYLCRDSFCVLVGEEALLRLSNADKGPRLQWPQKTFHGRLREPLDDEDRQRVEYAGQSLMECALDEFIQLAGTEMHWLLELPAFQSVLRHTRDKCENCMFAPRVFSKLKSYVRGHIVSILTKPAITWAARTSRYIDFDDYPTRKFANSYDEMRYAERLTSKTFWKMLKFENYDDRFAFPDKKFLNSTVADLGEHLYPFQAQKNATIGYVDFTDILSEMNQYNRHADPISPRFGFRQLAGATLIEGGMIEESPTAVFLNPIGFFQEVRSYLTDIGEIMADNSRHEASFHVTDTLTCLTDSETKYLPLWAGGNDDGSGGVFTDQGIPNLETGGFSTPGPAIHTGSTVSSTTSSFSITSSDFESTVQGASHRATGGYWTDIMSVNSESCVVADENHASTSSETQADTDNHSLTLEMSDDDVDDCFDTDSEDNNTVIMDSSVEETSERLEHMGLGVEAFPE